MFFSNNDKEAMLYYLYMMADGEISHGEVKIFNTICKELKIDNDTKSSVIDEAKKLLNGTKNVFSIIVREKIDEQVGEGWFGLRDKSALTRIIWNLINLGYADSIYSEEEKLIVNYLMDKWSISQEIYHEFMDISDTILALTKQKEWIHFTYFANRRIEKKEDYIDSEIEQLIDDVNLTIEEISM